MMWMGGIIRKKGKKSLSACEVDNKIWALVPHELERVKEGDEKQMMKQEEEEEERRMRSGTGKTEDPQAYELGDVSLI
jgi:hypothetical protein